MPGCLSYLSTLISPLENKLVRAKENFSRKAEDLSDRLALVIWQVDDNTRQNAKLEQRQECMETQTAQLKRQQSAMSEEVDSRISEMEKQNSVVSDGLSSSLEKSASSLDSVEQRTQALEEQAVHTVLTAQCMAGDIEQLTTQMERVATQVAKAEDGATTAIEKWEKMQLLLNNRQNMDRSREENEMSSLHFRLESVEKKFQNLGANSSPPKPMRSISN